MLLPSSIPIASQALEKEVVTALRSAQKTESAMADFVAGMHAVDAATAASILSRAVVAEPAMVAEFEVGKRAA